MNLYETIFKRRSVRNYDMTPLDEKVISDIQHFLLSTQQLPEQNARFEIVCADKVKGAKAPHYIMCYCKPGDVAYANVGYVLQRVDLYIQSQGLGSLWLGMGKQKEKEDSFCIMLAFGRSDVPFRTDEREFNRLSVNEISNLDTSVARAARLAPSACNSQPWELFFEEECVRVRYHGRGFMKMMLRAKLNKIDIGIVTRHIVTALENDGVKIEKIISKSSDKNFEIRIEYK